MLFGVTCADCGAVPATGPGLRGGRENQFSRSGQGGRPRRAEGGREAREARAGQPMATRPPGKRVGQRPSQQIWPELPVSCTVQCVTHPQCPEASLGELGAPPWPVPGWISSPTAPAETCCTCPECRLQPLSGIDSPAASNNHDAQVRAATRNGSRKDFIQRPIYGAPEERSMKHFVTAIGLPDYPHTSVTGLSDGAGPPLRYPCPP